MAKRDKTLDCESKENIALSNMERTHYFQREKDPMICRACDNYHVYMGEVCLENGRLEIKIAFIKEARSYMERVIHYLEQSKEPKKAKKETERERPPAAIEEEPSCQLSLFDVS